MNSAEFIKYISNPMTLEDMQLMYKANNIVYDKCELYYDFILTLNYIIVDTFLGDDCINSNQDIHNHFIWCIEKVFNNFNKENIVFSHNEDIKEYFYNFYLELFYNQPEKEGVIKKLNKLAELSFDYKRIKTRSDLDVLLELYRLFEKSLNFKLKT